MAQKSSSFSNPCIPTSKLHPPVGTVLSALQYSWLIGSRTQRSLSLQMLKSLIESDRTLQKTYIHPLVYILNHFWIIYNTTCNVNAAYILVSTVRD